MQRSISLRATAFVYGLITTITIAITPGTSAQGFGVDKETITLHTVLPAVVQLSNPDLHIVVVATAQNSAEFAKSLLPELRSILQQSDSRVVIESDGDAAKARVLVECSITRFTPYTSKVTQVSPDYKYKGKTTAGEKDNNITATLTIAYRAIDIKTKHPLDAAVIEEKYNETFVVGGKKKKTGSFLGQIKGQVDDVKNSLTGKGQADQEDESIPTVQQVNARLDQNISLKLAARLVNTDKKVQIKLAKGKLEHEAKVATAEDWQLMEKDLIAMGEFPKSEDESYRQYDLGVAHEAMGYKSAAKPEDAAPLFESAAKEYKAAINANPAEKYFLETQVRIETALSNTETRKERAQNGNRIPQSDLKETQIASTESEAPKPTPANAPVVKLASAGDDDVLSNASIIDLSKKGVDAENLIATIHDARKVNFILTASALIDLKDAKVPNEVITAMRQKLHGARVPAPVRPAGPNGAHQ